LALEVPILDTPASIISRLNFKVEIPPEAFTDKSPQTDLIVLISLILAPEPP